MFFKMICGGRSKKVVLENALTYFGRWLTEFDLRLQYNICMLFTSYFTLVSIYHIILFGGLVYIVLADYSNGCLFSDEQYTSTRCPISDER